MEHIADVVSAEQRDLAADLAFLYQEHYALFPERTTRLDALRDQLLAAQESVIAISVSAVVSGLAKRRGLDYETVLQHAVADLLAQGHRVVIFPNACREVMDSTHNNDIPIIRDVRERLGAHEAIARAHWVENVVNTAAIRRMLSVCDVLLASRFHAMVAGLSLGVPTMVLGWSHKYQEVMAMFGVEDRFLRWEDMRAEAIVAALGQLLAERELLQRRLREKRPAVESLAIRQIEWLAAFPQPPAQDHDECSA